MKTEHIILGILLVAVLALIFIINQTVKRGQHVTISLPPVSIEFNKS